MKALTAAHKQLLIGQAIGGVVLNAILNGAAAWLLFPPVASIPMWAQGNCVGGDTIGTSFFLPLTTCLVLTPIVRRTLAPRGPVAPISRADLPPWARWMPANFVGRGAAIGLVCALTIAIAVAMLVTAAGVTAMTRGEVTAYKAIYTALLGAIGTPLFGLRALADAAAPRTASAAARARPRSTPPV